MLTKQQAKALLLLAESLADSNLQVGAASAMSEKAFIDAVKISAEAKRRFLIYLDQLTEE